MTEKVLKHIVEEFKRIKPYLNGNIKDIESKLKNEGYIDIGITSKASVFRVSPNFELAKLDLKKPEELGRYQIRLWDDRTGIIDWDNVDPDGNPLKTVLHTVDLAYYFLAEFLDLLNIEGLKLGKNYINFKF